MQQVCSWGSRMENAYVLKLSDSKFKDLFLCFCGIAECQPLHYFGPSVRPNYVIHVILEGKGVYQADGKKYELQAGQAFVVEPEVLTFYQADEKEPWTYFWIGFGGTRAKEYLNDAGLGGGNLTFQTDQGKELKKIVLGMLNVKEWTVSNQYLLQSYLYQFFAVLTRDAMAGEKEESMESAYIRHAIRYIRNHYAKDLKVTDIANDICVDRSYLYKLFKKALQMSPKEFIMQFRISKSKELLTVTKLSIEEIASSCGYQDFRVFSKVFKKDTGVSPSAYRREHWQNNRQERLQGEKNLEDWLNEKHLNTFRKQKYLTGGAGTAYNKGQQSEE